MKILKNAKFWIIIIAIIILSILLYKNISSEKSESNIENIKSPSIITPDRPAEINGLVRSIEGNEIIIANEIKEKNLIEGEQDSQREDRQAMTQEDRQALKAEEFENLEIENLTIIIPVGVTIIKGSGIADGENLLAELSEIKTGNYLSIWISNDQVETVKLKGVN